MPNAVRLAAGSGGDPAALRIACRHFSREEVDALRSLLRLIQPYLKRPWVVSEGGDAELCLVNLDAEGGAATAGVGQRVVGCATKPRRFQLGTLHRPLRVPEMLAVLSEIQDAAPTPDEAVAWAYRLHAWPADIEAWPRPWWRVLACVGGAALTLPEIAARTGLPLAEVERCLARATAQCCVERLALRRSPVAAAVDATARPWAQWAVRLGRLLGLAS
jgi:hypothetical protein